MVGKEPRFWRRTASSAGLPPRVLMRVFVGPEELEATVASYERVQGVERDAVFDLAGAGLSLVSVGAFLVIAGSAADLAPFRATVGTLLVDEIAPYHERLVAEGADIVATPHEVPTGAGLTARMPDGTVVEVVQHRPRPSGD